MSKPHCETYKVKDIFLFGVLQAFADNGSDSSESSALSNCNFTPSTDRNRAQLGAVLVVLLKAVASQTEPRPRRALYYD